MGPCSVGLLHALNAVGEVGGEVLVFVAITDEYSALQGTRTRASRVAICFSD